MNKPPLAARVFRVLDGVFAVFWACLSVGAYYGGSATGMVLCGLASLYGCAECVMGVDSWESRWFTADETCRHLVAPGVLIRKDGRLYLIRHVLGEMVLARGVSWQRRLWWWAIGAKTPLGEVQK